MPTRLLPIEIAQEAVLRVENELRAGCTPLNVFGGTSAVMAAARRAVDEGWVRATATFDSRLAVAKERHKLEPDWSLYRPRQYQHRPPGAPIIPSQDHIFEEMPDGEPETVAIIGDCHDSPHLPDKSRFEWLGAFCNEHGVSRVVQTGDWWTMDCFSSHTDRATFEGFGKPTFEQDRESFHASQRAFHKGLDGLKPKLDVTLGNHEVRAWRYTNAHPDGVSYSTLVEEAFAQWGWRTTPYGEFRIIGGVGFTHVPFNGLGRPLAQGQRANKAMLDIVHGDDHRTLMLTDHKSGPFRSPVVYSAGCALPPGFIEGFANKGGSTWRSGVCLATIWGGFVRSWRFDEMILLKRRYGK